MLKTILDRMKTKEKHTISFEQTLFQTEEKIRVTQTWTNTRLEGYKHWQAQFWHKKSTNPELLLIA